MRLKYDPDGNLEVLNDRKRFVGRWLYDSDSRTFSCQNAKAETLFLTHGGLEWHSYEAVDNWVSESDANHAEYEAHSDMIQCSAAEACIMSSVLMDVDALAGGFK